MPRCPYCAEEVPEKVKVCPHCDMQLRPGTADTIGPSPIPAARVKMKPASSRQLPDRRETWRPFPVLIGTLTLVAVLVIGIGVCFWWRGGGERRPSPAASSQAKPSPTPEKKELVWSPTPIPPDATPLQAVEMAINNLNSSPRFSWIQTTVTRTGEKVDTGFWDGEIEKSGRTVQRFGDLNDTMNNSWAISEDGGKKLGWGPGRQGWGDLEKLRASRAISDLILAHLMETRRPPQFDPEKLLAHVREVRRAGDMYVAEMNDLDEPVSEDRPQSLRFGINNHVLTRFEQHFSRSKKEKGQDVEVLSASNWEFYDVASPKRIIPAIPPTLDVNAPESFRVKFTTTQGDFVVAVHAEWAPRAAQRFQELVESGIYDGCKFYCITLNPYGGQKRDWVRFGINGAPSINAQWCYRRFPDDPPRLYLKPGNPPKRGTICFDKLILENSRTTQLIITCAGTGDTRTHPPFGEVVEGMDVLDKLNMEYGDQPSKSLQRIVEEGNSFLERAYPRLDAILTAKIMDRPSVP